jgi:hypothetical protein
MVFLFPQFFLFLSKLSILAKLLLIFHQLLVDAANYFYLQREEGLANEMVAVLPKIKAVVGDHPDPKFDPAQNTD